VAFSLQFQGQDIGTAVIPGLVLLPGDNIIATQVHYQPNGDVATAVGQQLLENFVQGTSRPSHPSPATSLTTLLPQESSPTPSSPETLARRRSPPSLPPSSRSSSRRRFLPSDRTSSRRPTSSSLSISERRESPLRQSRLGIPSHPPSISSISSRTRRTKGSI
jgi:hypothetical protein